jgi:hypothetical protein
MSDAWTHFWGAGSNPFSNFQFDKGGNIDPFTALRNNLGVTLFRNAGVFGDQGVGFLSSQGRFDPNLAEAMRQHAFGNAQESLSSGLASLAGQEGVFREGQREFNVGTELKAKELGAEWDAAQSNIWDVLSSIGQLGLGIGTFGATEAGKGAWHWLSTLFGKTQGTDPSFNNPFFGGQ